MQAIVRAETFLAVLDMNSPSNRTGHFQASLDQAWERIRPAGGPPAAAGDMDRHADCVEQYWNLRQAAREIFVWGSGSGAYKVELGLGQIGRGGALLECPSGRLTVCTLKGLGAGELVLKVAPGVYRAVLKVDGEQKRRHWMMPEGAGYPEGEGPDFFVSLSPA